MAYKIVIIDNFEGVIETIVPDYDDVVKIMLLLKDSSSYRLKEICELKDYQPYEDIIEILKEDVKPKDLETGKRRKVK